MAYFLRKPPQTLPLDTLLGKHKMFFYELRSTGCEVVLYEWSICVCLSPSRLSPSYLFRCLILRTSSRMVFTYLSPDPEILLIRRQVLRAVRGGGDRPDGPPQDEGGQEVPQEGGHHHQGAGQKGWLGGGRDGPCPHLIQVTQAAWRK